MQSGGVYSLNNDNTMSFWLHLTPVFQNLPPPLHHHNCVRVHPNAIPQYMKVLKHFIYMYYGCVMQSGGVYSLNNDTTTSCLLRLTTNFPNFSPPLHHHNCVRVHPNAIPQHMKVLQHFIYMYCGCVMQSGAVYSLNNDTTMSFLLRLTPIFQKLPPPPAPS